MITIRIQLEDHYKGRSTEQEAELAASIPLEGPDAEKIVTQAVDCLKRVLEAGGYVQGNSS